MRMRAMCVYYRVNLYYGYLPIPKPINGNDLSLELQPLSRC